MDQTECNDNRDKCSATAGKLIHEEITRDIIGAAMEVHRNLGAGFLEKVYENALAVELRSRGLSVEQQSPVSVRYKEQVVGEYFADLLVAETVIVDMKTVERLCEAHEAQTLNYLRATGIKVGLVMNFSTPRLEWKRLIA